MFGQYDSSDLSMDALGLDVNSNMYDTQSRKTKGRYYRNIIIFSFVMLIAIAVIVIIFGRFRQEQRIITNGSVIEAEYNSSSDRYSARIPYANGEERLKSWENAWEYVNNGDTMNIYTLVENGRTYAAPRTSAAAWVLMYSVPGVIVLGMAVCVALAVRGILKLKKDK